MGWGKILAGGIGFMFGGPIGAALAVGAAHAGGKMMEAEKEKEATNAQASSNDAKREELMRQRARRLEAQKAKEAEENRRLEEERKKAEAEAAATAAEREQWLIALMAVGMAAGSVDGAMSAEENHEMQEVLKQANGNAELPAAVKARMKEYQEKAPTFMKAKKEVEKLKNPDVKMFRVLIENIVHSDNEVSPEEEDFLEKWDTFFPARD